MITNPIKAIRAKCLDCCAGQPSEVKECTVTDCHLFAFRFGKNPHRAKRKLTDDQKKQMADRLAAGRKAKLLA